MLKVCLLLLVTIGSAVGIRCCVMTPEVQQEIQDAQDDLERSEKGLRFSSRPESIIKGVDRERMTGNGQFELEE